jgi:hypothetical protein
MREIRQSGSEGGGTANRPSLPLSFVLFRVLGQKAVCSSIGDAEQNESQSGDSRRTPKRIATLAMVSRAQPAQIAWIVAWPIRAKSPSTFCRC